MTNPAHVAAPIGCLSPLLGLMFLIMFTLKLCQIIDLSWWWVTAPLWGGALLFITLFVAVIGVTIIAMIIGRR